MTWEITLPSKHNGGILLTQDNNDPQLDLKTLADAIALIDISISRGAYTPDELLYVYQTYQKIKEFIEYNSKKEE
jgi:hypothetical protein